MIMTAVLIDRTFLMQTHETFEAPFAAKTGAFETLEKVVDIDSLDFVLAFSSVAGMIGNAGQTNYSRFEITPSVCHHAHTSLQRKHCFDRSDKTLQECSHHCPTVHQQRRCNPRHSGY